MTLEHKVKLWDAINRVVDASGGNVGNTSTKRQLAVVAVENSVEEIVRDEFKDLMKAAKALVAAADSCERETSKQHPSSRSSAPVARYLVALARLRDAINKMEGS